MATETVFMKSPSGEIREVEPTEKNLTPLMAAGWMQHHPEKSPEAPAVEEAK